MSTSSAKRRTPPVHGVDPDGGHPEIAAPRSLSVAVHAEMRSEILAGRFVPGSRLRPSELARRFGVSLSVVREALTRLTEQGFVVSTPQLGFSVTPLDIDDLLDIARARVLIEGAALREAIEHADLEYETAVVAAHHRLSRTPFLQDAPAGVVTEEWAAAHFTFHNALISASPSPLLRDLAAGLRDRAELYRRWSGPLNGDPTPRDVPNEHRLLLAAVLDRDADRAVELLSSHIVVTAEALAAYGRAQSGSGRSDDAAATGTGLAN